MKQLILCVAVLAIVLSGMAFAGEEQKKDEPTIVGPVMQGRYTYLTPQEEVEALSETSQKLMDQGVIQAAEEKRTRETVQQPKKK